MIPYISYGNTEFIVIHSSIDTDRTENNMIQF